MIDLHMHSTYSDGSLTPEDLVRLGRDRGLSAMALTDHDTLKGIPFFLDACGRASLRGITGVEISAEYGSGTLHMLGYLVEPGNKELEEALSMIRGGREERNRKILRKLNEFGIPITWEEVAARAGEDVVGRPHFAMALVSRGVVKSTEEAFEKFLAKGKPAYVDRLRMSPEVSIRLIREAGGVAVLAHPFTLGLRSKALRQYVGETLAPAGLGGIEAYYSEHTAEQEGEYLALAREFGLALTGGSDFHGAMNPDISLGSGFGRLRVPDNLVDGLYAKAGRHGN